MVGNLTPIEEQLLEILIINSLLTLKESQYLKQYRVDFDVSLWELLLRDHILQQDQLILILHHYFSFSIISSKTVSNNCQIIKHYKFEDYLNNGYFIYKDEYSKTKIAINNLSIIPNFLEFLDCKELIVLIQKRDFNYLLEQNFSRLNLSISTTYLECISKKLTAKNIDYKSCVILFLVSYVALIYELPILFHLLSNGSYFAQNLLKLILFKKAINKSKMIQFSNAKIVDYPVYSLLIPLYQEELLIEKILFAINCLNYPKNKLDVKLIIEEDDSDTIDVLSKIIIPDYVHIVKVPFSNPRTKPKALNYAINYATGKYLVVYDAEDRPHPDQLLKSLEMFASLPEEYACLQANLNFYNNEETLLSQLFSIEYHFWFSYMLKGLSKLDLPLSLGGTSNHFKTDILRKVGFWDAYNVTEDADLGIRLYLNGYKVNMLDSITLEEAPIEIKNWINQRSRWIKGFLQTFLVFLKQDILFKKLSIRQYCTVCIFIGMSTYNFFCLPWIIFLVLFNKNEFLNFLWYINSFFAITYLYSVACYILIKEKGCLSKFSLINWVAIIIWPLYFVLHTIACYKALWEVCRSPFKWNKTKHGISKT